MTQYPWNDYTPAPSKLEHRYLWDCENYPFVVRWSVSTGERLSKWRTLIREFATLEEAVAAYKRPFKGLGVDLVKYNGGKPGQHLDTLAHRKCGKKTIWSSAIPVELR